MPCSTTHFDQQIGSGSDVNRDAYRRIMIYVTYAGNPTNNLTPQFIGQFCFDTTNSVFIAVGLAAANWAAIHS